MVDNRLAPTPSAAPAHRRMPWRNSPRSRPTKPAAGAMVFAHACKLGLEGIVSKRVLSRYRSGTSRNRLKCLNPEFERR
jgi:ATP-dependent DNA ligase